MKAIEMKTETAHEIAERNWQTFIDTPRTTISGTPVFLFPQWVIELIETAVKDAVEQAASIAISFIPDDLKTPAPRIPAMVADRIRARMLSKEYG